MKRILIILFVFVATYLCHSQIINYNYFPKNNEIDLQYEYDNGKWITNSEWREVIEKYNRVWYKQMKLEMERLIKILPNQEKVIRENQNNWEKTLKESYDLVNSTIDGNRIGKEPYLEYWAEELEQYKERAKILFLFILYTSRDG